MKRTNPPEGSPRPGKPSDTVRSIVSLLVFIHLFSVVCISFSLPPSSGLLARFRAVPLLSSYLHFLFLETSYRNPLMRGDEADAGGSILIGTTDDQLLEFTSYDIQPPLRSGRYAALFSQAQRSARNAKEDGASRDARNERFTILPKAIGSGMMKQNGATEADIEIRGRLLETYEEASSVDAFADDRYYAVLYGNIVVAPSGEVLYVDQELEDRRNAPAPEEATP